MGAFNIVSAVAECPLCGSKRLREIQFKHGKIRQYRYSIGDAVVADSNAPLLQSEVVSGTTECEVCLTRYLKCQIRLRDGKIAAAEILPALLGGAKPQGDSSARRQKRRP